MQIFQFLEKKISDPRQKVMAVLMQVFFQVTRQGKVFKEEISSSMLLECIMGDEHFKWVF